MKKTLAKTIEGMDYVKDGIEKVRSKKWSEPVGLALGVTASICQGMGTFVPGLGILGGALKIGSSILNPSPSLADLKRNQKDIEDSLTGSTGAAKEFLEQKLEELKEHIKTPPPEITQDIELIKAEVQATAITMAMDMRRIERDLSEVKNVINYTFSLVRDSRYRDGIEKIDSSYNIFLKGSNNLEKTFAQLDSYIYELMVLANQNLSGQRIREYLKVLRLTEDVSVCEQMLNYVLIVRARYLQLSSAYYIYNKDIDRVAEEFTWFNKDYAELCTIFRDEIGYEFKPGQVTSEFSAEKSNYNNFI